MTLELRIPLPDGPIPTVGALLDNPDGTEAPVLLAHGAGLDMGHEFMADVARALAERGFPVLRFRYPYMERMAQGESRRPPDRMPALEACHRAAARVLSERFPERPLLFVGKSMGGRVGSHLAAAGVPCRGLAFLGYPLHPPGKPEKLRDEHFPHLSVPALFLQGTRDALAELDLVRASLKKYAGTATLEIVEGANHAFEVLAAQRRSLQEVRVDLAARLHAWNAEL